MFTLIERILLGFIAILTGALVYLLILVTQQTNAALITANLLNEQTQLFIKQTNITLKDHEISNAQHEARNNKQVELVKQLLKDHEKFMEKFDAK